MGKKHSKANLDTYEKECGTSIIPAYIEDPTYHGHGGRVFVSSDACVPSKWTLDTGVTAPEGQKAYVIPRHIMETLYLQDLYQYTPEVFKLKAPVQPVAGLPGVGYLNL